MARLMKAYFNLREGIKNCKSKLMMLLFPRFFLVNLVSLFFSFFRYKKQSNRIFLFVSYNRVQIHNYKIDRSVIKCKLEIEIIKFIKDCSFKF